MTSPQVNVLEINIDKTKIIAGDFIQVTLKITNIENEDRTYDLSPPPFDMLLYYENGTLWARWTDGQAFPEIYINKTLVLGESYQESFYWNLYRYDFTTLKFIRPEPGIYVLEGILRSKTNIKTEKINIEIEPRD